LQNNAAAKRDKLRYCAADGQAYDLICQFERQRLKRTYFLAKKGQAAGRGNLVWSPIVLNVNFRASSSSSSTRSPTPLSY